MEIAETLTQRNAQYGDFAAQSAIAQTLKKVLRANGRFEKLKPDQREALDHIAIKISRILNGNADHWDSWHDIAGYSTLVANRIAKPVEPAVD
jgi:uncharacterized protein DUF6378